METNNQSVKYELENTTYNVTRIFGENMNISDIIKSIILHKYKGQRGKINSEKHFNTGEEYVIIKKE